MEIIADHSFMLEIRDPETGCVLWQEPLGSLARFAEYGLFASFCQGCLTPQAYGAVECVVAEALFADENLKPYITGITLHFETGTPFGSVMRNLSILDFYDRAQKAGQTLIRQGLLQNNSQIKYRISAAPNGWPDVSGHIPSSPRLKTRVVETRKPIVEARVAAMFGEVAATPEELFDVYVMKPVLDAVLRQAREARQNENASFLIGFLGHDADTERVFLAVTAAVAAGAGTRSTCTSFTFSGETFLEAETYIAEHRPSFESCVGWEHNHTYCLGCSKRSQCSASTVFWSVDDEQVQASAFSLPHQVALVVGLEHDASESDGRYSYAVKMYGWQGLAMSERKFTVVGNGGFYATNR